MYPTMVAGWYKMVKFWHDARTRILFFLIGALLFDFGRRIFIRHFFQLEILGGDPSLTEFFYAVIPLTTIALWKKLGSIKLAAHPRLTYFMTACILSGMLVVPLPTIIHTAFELTLFELCIHGAALFLLALIFLDIHIIKKFVFEILCIAASTTLMKSLSFFVDTKWATLSKSTLYGIKSILKIAHQDFSIDMPQQLVRVNNFFVTVGPRCAGLGILAAFLLLLIFATALAHEHGKKIILWRLLLILLGGLGAAYITNTIRIVLILLIGAHVSQDFAISTFHANIGAILFLGIFIVYITKGVQWATQKN